MKKFKDKCDICGHFDILKGNNKQCLCSKCIKNSNLNEKNNNYYSAKKTIEKQLSIFDLEVLFNGR